MTNMRTYFKILFLTLLLYPSLVSSITNDSLRISKLEFVENKGQWDNPISFKANINSGNIWIEENAITFDLYDSKAIEQLSNHKEGKKLLLEKGINRHSYQIEFIGVNRDCKITGVDKFEHYNNYYLGNDKSKWAHNASIYNSVIYNDLYKDIDLVIYEDNYNLKWDFIVKANADLSSIKLNYKGVDKLKIKKGNLEITTSVNKVTELKPIAYQKDINGKSKEIACKFILEDNTLSFEFPEGYDKNKELIIDPTLIFATYSGSTSDNWGFTATYDDEGFLYAGGIVFGNGYPTTIGAFQTNYDSLVDIGITKYDTTGSFLIYSTYLGGNYLEVPASLIVNNNNELLVFGTTSSLTFPTTQQAYDTIFNGGSSITISSYITFANGADLFISRFSSDGSQLMASTYLGGSGNDGTMPSSPLVTNYGDDIRGEIVIDANNNIYVVSTTGSANFPVSGSAFQTVKAANSDGIIVKLDNNLSSIIWSSFFGGNSNDAIYGIKVRPNFDIYITGGTSSTDIATTSNSYQTNYQGGSADGYIAEIAANGQSITHCTYVGSTQYDQSYLIDLDKYNNVYIFGQTKDTGNVFIHNALWNSPKDGQFITKFNPTLSSRVWSTTWGNGQAGIDVVPSAFMVDLCNRVYLSAWGGAVNDSTFGGFAGGSTFNLPITSNAIQSTTDGSDYYLMVMTDDASGLDYGSYYGGSTSHEHVDGGTSRFDNKGRIYQNVCAGCGGNSDFPTTTGCHSSTNNSGNCNNGVFKVDFNIPAIVADYIIPPVICLPDTSFFVNTSFLSHAATTQYFWDFDDGNSSTQESPWHIYGQSGIYQVTLIIIDPQSCNISDTITQQIVVLSGANNTLPTEYLCPGATTQIGLLPIQDTSVYFSWTPSTGLSDTSICNPYASPMVTTNYTLTATNGLCTDTIHQKVSVLYLIADAGNDTTLCNNSITLTGSGNFNDLNYLWSSTNLFNDTLNNYPTDSSYNHSFTNSTYLFFQVNNYGCSDYDSLFIDQRVIITPSSIQNPLCFNDANGSITINVQGAITPITFNWSNGEITQNISNLPAGMYSLSIIDNDGCEATFDTLLIEPLELTVDTLSESIPCDIACIGKAFANPQGGTTPYQWVWDDSFTQATNPAIQLCDGIYTVTVTDANNCIHLDTVEVKDESVSISFYAWASKDTIYEGESSQLNSTILNNNYAYSWQPVGGLSNSTISNPIATPGATTTYTVIATDPYGCTWTDTITIYITDVICDEPYIYVPNAFTPNNDGKNDVLKVESSVGYDLVFQIFDRWGELVFETTDIDRAWDGNFNGKELSAGVYVYHLTLICYNHHTFSKKGNITLIR